MRSLRFPAIVAFITLLATSACDPGSSVKPEPEPLGSAGSANSPKEVNPLWNLPKEPPGTVNMTPPAAGELDAFEQNLALGRGMNLGNALDAPKEGSWGVTLHQYMFEVIKEAGFDSIRLPVKWSNYAEEAAPYTINPKIFERVDWAVAHALTRGLRIIVDIHHYGSADGKEPGIYAEPDAHHERFLALWTQIAEHYKDYPKELYFEVLNEPRGKLESRWNKYLAEAIAVIRESNPGRTLIVGGIWWNKWDALAKVVFPADDNNIIATFHYYNPYCFTLQDGQDWEPVCVVPDELLKAGEDSRKPKQGEASWPLIYSTNSAEAAATERAKLEQDLAASAAWGKSANRPLYMGEFGVHKAANATARIDYTTSIARAAENNGITWAYWELASTFGIWQTGKMIWDNAMLEALIPPGTSFPKDTPGAGGQGNTTTAGGTSSLGSAGAASAAAGGGTGGGI